MTVKLRQTGNSRTLTVPSGIKATGEEYTVKNVGKTIVFTPVAKRKIFLPPKIGKNTIIKKISKTTQHYSQ